MTRVDRTAALRAQLKDLGVWALLVLVGLGLTWWAVRAGAQLGTAGAPFLGAYRWHVTAASLSAPAVAAAVLVAAATGWLNRPSWPLLQLYGYLSTVAWTLALAFADGTAGLTRGLAAPDGQLADLPAVGDDPLHYLRTFTDPAAHQAVAARAHPPAPVLLLWALERAGVRDHLALGLGLTAAGALVVPLVLSAVRGVCGEVTARQYLPVLALAPYAVWLSANPDTIAAVLGAAMIASGVRASDRRSTGARAGGWALLSGILLGVGSLFAYAVAWLGLSVVFLYFARRRPFLNVATALGALAPILAAQVLGFGWLEGLLAARDDFAVRVQPHRSALWWSGISVVALLLAAGPALIASLRKLRNTPGWPFLVGAGAAVVFSVVTGLARGGVEYAWLTFFPWLTVAAVAPLRQGGPPVNAPLILVGAGALTAVAIQAVVATVR